MHLISSCCKICSLGKIINELAFLLLEFLCNAINYYLIRQVKIDKQASYDTICSLLRSLTSSVIIGFYRYYSEEAVLPKERSGGAEGRKTQELEPLIRK